LDYSRNKLAFYSLSLTHPLGTLTPLLLTPQQSWTLEICILLGISLYILCMIYGRYANLSLAHRWVDHTRPLLHHQFASTPPNLSPREAKSSLLKKDGLDIFKIYSTGRRGCSGMLLTLHLVKRQDLVTGHIVPLFSPSDPDIIEAEILVNPATMPSTCFVIALSSLAKTMGGSRKDVQQFTKTITSPDTKRLGGGGGGWPGHKLTVMAEHAGVFYDLMAATGAMESVFGASSWDVVGRYFRSIHITSNLSVGNSEDGSSKDSSHHKQVVRLTMSLPPASVAQDVIERLLTFMLLLVDGLAMTKLTAEQEKKAVEARKRAAALQERSEGGGIDALKRKAEERKAEKLRAELKRLSRLPPEQREKEIQKKQKIAENRMLKRRMKTV
jgi:hypothetical protein